MGLFDGYVDPEQFNSGGGLLGRLLALQRLPEQSDAKLDQPSATLQAPSLTSTASPIPFAAGQWSLRGPLLTPNLDTQYPASRPISGDQGGAATSNAVLAQYYPVRPVGIPLPPVFIPKTRENDAFVHSTIGAGRSILGAIGSILNSDNNENPVSGTTPEPETKGRSKIFQKPGGYDDAVKDFNDLNPTNVRPLPNGGLIGTLPDGRNVNVRPDSSDGRPTIEIQDTKKSIKTRYGDK